MSTVVQHDAPPSATAPQRSRLVVVAGSLVFVVAGTLLQLPRQSGVHMWRTVWAEDGTQFYAGALARPWLDNVLEPYAGYAHVVPRTLASIGVHLPLSTYSAFVTITAALSAALLALFVYFASAPLLRSSVRQAILVLALLFWPVLPFEITGSITNIQWAMPVACLLAVLLPVERPISIAVRLPIAVLATLSSPLCVLFVPIALWHVVRFFTRHTSPVRLIVPVLYSTAAAVQLAVFATAPQVTPVRPPLDALAPDLGRLYGTKVATEFFFGVGVTRDLWNNYGYRVAWVSLVVLTGLLVWRFWRATTMSRCVIVGCAFASGAIYASSVWQRSGTIGDMIVTSGQPYNFGAMRYELFPSALLLIALLVSLDLERGAIAEPWSPPPRRLLDEIRGQWAAIAVAGVWALVAFVPSYQLSNGRSGGPDWIAGVEDAEQTCTRAPTPPDVVSVPISPQPIWFVSLPCQELAEAG